MAVKGNANKYEALLFYEFPAETRNYSIVLVFIASSFRAEKRIDYPKLICLAYPLSFKCFTALKGTHLYIFV